MVPKVCFTIVLFHAILTYSANSQNLVVNGSFEEHVSCPTKKGSLSQVVKSLKAPTLGSTDYFHICGSRPMGIPDNFNGSQAAFDGEGYAGLYLFSQSDYREYLQLQLSKTLERGRTYHISFRLSLAEKSGFSIKEASVLFVDRLLQLDTNKNLSPRRLHGFKITQFAFLKLNIKGRIYDTKDWVLVEADYVAKGNENYLIFGNFKNDRYSNMFPLKSKQTRRLPLSYYYMDDVKVTAVEQHNFKLNVPFVLNRLQFEFDKHELTKKSKKELHKLYGYLKQHSNVKVSIYGHTDDLGTSEYNKYLSSRRARVVAQYLEELGVSKKRILWQGKGGNQPLYNDKSNTARKANRRVEFVMTTFEDN